MIYNPQRPSVTTESDLEWDRLRQFLSADDPPLAIIEVESAHQANRILDVLAGTSPNLHGRVCHVTNATNAPQVADWLNETKRVPGSNLLSVVSMLEDVSFDESQARPFWTEANALRERWRAPSGKTVLLLIPPHVNNLARWADALWDWIPLKFNLLHAHRDDASSLHQTQSRDARPSRTNPGDAAARVPALCEQLQRARERGLAESIIRREYAWPLFTALAACGRLRDAETLLRNELSENFAAELDEKDCIEWLETLGYLYLELWRLDDAGRVFTNLADFAAGRQDEKSLCVGFHGLGMIAQKQRDFTAAEQWYRKSLAISEKLGNEHGAASTYHQLGMIAEEQRELAAAERWYRKAVRVFERLGLEHHAASTYHQLGVNAQAQRDFAAGERWYRKSLAIAEKLKDEHGAAPTYHQLGMIAEAQRDFAVAEEWYRKSLAIKEKQGNEHGAAITYHQLGTIAEEQRDFTAAAERYGKAVQVFERLGGEHYAAATYHQLGMIAQAQRDFAAAEQWYHKSLAIKEKQGNEHGAAITFVQLGILAGVQERFKESGQWFIKSITAFARCNDARMVQQSASNFAITYYRAPAQVRIKLEAMWRDAGLGELPTQDEEEPT